MSNDIIILKEGESSKEISKEELEALRKSPGVKLNEVEKGVYVRLEKIYG